MNLPLIALVAGAVLSGDNPTLNFVGCVDSFRTAVGEYVLIERPPTFAAAHALEVRCFQDGSVVVAAKASGIERRVEGAVEAAFLVREVGVVATEMLAELDARDEEQARKRHVARDTQAVVQSPPPAVPANPASGWLAWVAGRLAAADSLDARSSAVSLALAREHPALGPSHAALSGELTYEWANTNRNLGSVATTIATAGLMWGLETRAPNLAVGVSVGGRAGWAELRGKAQAPAATGASVSGLIFAPVARLSLRVPLQRLQVMLQADAGHWLGHLEGAVEAEDSVAARGAFYGLSLGLGWASGAQRNFTQAKDL